MEFLSDLLTTMVTQLQKPTLSFLIGGMVLAALGSQFKVPDAIYKFIVMVLLLKVGLEAGISVREADLAELLVPAIAAMVTGIAIVLIGAVTLARARGVSPVDGIATSGLFGAVSASTLAAGMAVMQDGGLPYEGFIGALYPFMDIAALVTAIVLGRLATARTATSGQGGAATMTLSFGGAGGGGHPGVVKEIITDTLRSSAVSALLLGLVLGIVARPDAVVESFYDPLFSGLLSLLMLILGMEAWSRLSELRKVAHAYIAYAVAAPIVHGLIGFGLGLVAHYLTGFSAGGVVLLAVMAASNSDISGPPTIRGALPEANPSAYIGSSTGIGTPVAILSIPLFVALADAVIGF